MRLADFIAANVEPILMEWEAFARSIWPGPATDPATLRDHAEQMLHAAVADMRSGQSDAEQSDKSKGKQADGPHAARVNRVSAEHAVARVGSGFDLAAVIAEYRALRASVIRLWRESDPATDANDLYDVTRFNESIDQSLTEAVVADARHVDRERAAAFEQQTRDGAALRKLNDELLVSAVRQHELTERAERAAAAMRDAKEEAEAANRAKDEFLATISHELRTPVSAVLLWTKLLKGGKLPAGQVPDALGTIETAAEAQRRLIDDLLDSARITSGKLRLELQDVDLAALVRSAVEAVAPTADVKHVALAADLADGVGVVRADPERLRQVLWNLLTNAVKFTPAGGRVEVGLSRRGDAVEVRVADTGQGIPGEFLPHVFEPFRQAERSTTRTHGGLGLGLSIVRRLVELHGGTVAVASAGVDRGTTFTVRLPLPPVRRANGRRPRRQGSESA